MALGSNRDLWRFWLRQVYRSQNGTHILLDLHVVVQRELSVREGHRLSHTVEDEILRALPQVAEVLVHVEPEEELTRPRE
jgi:divalent metal cation (Fe/Co/Zn/Cd) transporter